MNLREFRNRRGLTPEQLAAYSGISVSTVKRAEATSAMSLRMVRMEATVLDLTPEEMARLWNKGDPVENLEGD